MSEERSRQNLDMTAIKRPGNVRRLDAFERVVRALRTLSLGNRTILRSSDEMTLLHDMSVLAVDLGGYRAAGVVYAEQEKPNRLRWMVWVSMCNGHPKALDITKLNNAGLTWTDDALGNAAVGVAIRTNAPRIGRSLLTDPVYTLPEYSTLRELSIANGVDSVTAFPLSYDGNVMGALFFSAGEPDAFDGEELSLLADLANDLAYAISAIRMREQRRLDQANIERLAFYDPYTGLPNRIQLLKMLAQALEKARFAQEALTVLHLKIGHIEDINQALGFHAVESLLKEIAKRLTGEIPADQTLARISDDSFGLIAPRHDRYEAIALANALVGKLNRPIDVCGLMIEVSVFVGLALCPTILNDKIDPESLVRRARTAVHLGTSPHTPIAVYAGDVEEENTTRLKLMSDLRRAVERNELQLYCQPKVDIRSRKILGAEALVRWQHPQYGFISPGRFIRLAEQSGMISSLTCWLLDAATEQLCIWQNAGMHQSLAINLSAHDLHNSGISSQIERMIVDKGIIPEFVQFEITESALIDDPDAALSVLARLKQLGISILIDDFGTGYSSLAYLQKFSVDGIKIDQSFVMPMLSNSDSAIIVHSTIELGHRLGLEVIAEGVENQAVWDRLLAFGCDTAQGYLVAMPMPVGQFKAWADNWALKHAS